MDSVIVLVELCWTLSFSYELWHADIARTIRALLDNSSIAESPPAVRNALNSFKTTTADFTDCLIVTKTSHASYSHTFIFDQRMESLPDVQLLYRGSL